MFHLKKNSCTSSGQKKKFVQAENSPPPHHFSNGPSLSLLLLATFHVSMITVCKNAAMGLTKKNVLSKVFHDGHTKSQQTGDTAEGLQSQVRRNRSWTHFIQGLGSLHRKAQLAVKQLRMNFMGSFSQLTSDIGTARKRRKRKFVDRKKGI